MWDDDDYDRDRYDRDRYDRHDHYSRYGRRDDSFLDDLIEMLFKAAFALLALFVVVYGFAWGIDQIGIFNTHLTSDLMQLITGWFDKSGDKGSQ